MTRVFVSGFGKTLRFREGEVTAQILLEATRKAALNYGGMYDPTQCTKAALTNLGGVSGLAERVAKEFLGTEASELEGCARDVVRGFLWGLEEHYINYSLR
jgi:hypothetical protein